MFIAAHLTIVLSLNALVILLFRLIQKKQV
jgi:hypothetical protein